MNGAALNAARLFEIAGVNIVLSGDNAVVVGMTVRNLAPSQRRIASVAGIWIAVLLQAAATLTVAHLLALPIVSLGGAFLLCAIAIRLLRHNGGAPQPPASIHPGRGVLRSTLTVIGAYFAMCLDNILAIAAIGRGHPLILIAGILLSSAVIIPASLVIANLMRRYPLTLTIGAAIVGWVAGSMLTGASHLDRVLSGEAARLVIPALMTMIVISSPLWLRCTQAMFSRADEG